MKTMKTVIFSSQTSESKNLKWIKLSKVAGASYEPIHPYSHPFWSKINMFKVYSIILTQEILRQGDFQLLSVLLKVKEL